MSDDRICGPFFMALAATLLATTSARGQTGTVPVRPLGKIVAQAKDTLLSVRSMRQLSDGHVFVEDGIGRRVLLFDSTLSKYTVVIDSGGSPIREFGPRSAAPLFAYAGDTTLFFDVGSQSFVVLDPKGAVVRTMAPPVPADAALIAGMMQANGTARFDPRGRLIYRGMSQGAARPTLTANGGMHSSGPSDTAASWPLVRATPGASAPDTLSEVRLIPRGAVARVKSPKGFWYSIGITNPIRVADDWVVTSDGSIAIIRGQDYHIDWIGLNGSRSSSPKLPFAWHRLSDSEKVSIVDSVKAVNAAQPMHAVVGSDCMSAGTNPGPCGEGPMDTLNIISGVIPADSLADYLPPFTPGTSLADAEGNVWLRPTPFTPLATTPGTVYDVVNRKGELIDRVQIPPSFSVVGFGPGMVYMTSREGAGVVLVRARIR